MKREVYFIVYLNGFIVVGTKGSREAKVFEDEPEAKAYAAFLAAKEKHNKINILRSSANLRGVEDLFPWNEDQAA